MNTFTLIDNIINSGIKLKLDSGKLKIIAPQDKLTPGLMEEIKSRKNEIIQLLSGINKSTAIIPVEKKEYYPASSAQKRLYIVQQMDMESTAYNIPQVMPFEIGIEQDKVEDIFIKLIARHESLHTSFIVVNEEIVQEIKEKVVFKIVRFQNQNEPLTASEANEIMLNFTRPFDLSEAPLLRVGVIKTNDGKCGFLLDMHHIVTDGTSQSILVKEFMALYNEAELPPLRLQYKDYSDWQNSKKQREVIKEQERYWLEIFSHEAPVINLPTDYPRPKTQGFEGSRVDFLLTVKESQALKEIAAQTGATLYMCILSVFTILLARLSGQEDIVVGTPIAARKHVDLEKVIGFFVNTLAMRISPCGEKSYKEFLLELKDHTLEAYENQEYPFEELVDKISGSRDTGRNPIFDVMFNLMNIEEYNQDTPGSEEREQYKNRHQKATSKFDLTLTAVDIGERFLLNIEYCTRLFKPGTIDRFISYFKNLFNSLSGGYNMKLSEFDIIAEEERHRILCEFNDTYAEYPKDKTIHRLFEEQVEQTSDHVAVVAPCIDTIHESHQQITYKELNEKSNRLAHGLQTKGVGPDTIVGIIMKRSVEMITGILGILKSGGAYLPIDEANPTERKKYMLEDSGVKLVLANKELLNRSGYLPGYIEIIDTGCEEYYSNDRTNFDYTPRGSDLVYMLYTSGSTGRPKGVMLEHSNLVNLFRFQFEYTNLKCSKILQFSALGFDAHFHEIFSALLSGGRIYLVAQEIRTDIPELFKLIERYGISTVFWPISFIKIIFSEEEYAKRVPLCLEHIQTAGEQVIISDNFRKYLKKNKVYLHNHYGPAETHVVTTLTINPGEDIPELPSIGKPILNTYIYIMDKKNHLSPIGVAGELWIGGVQVGRGYCGREELTGEKFIRNPFRLDEKVYKSGDLARWLTNGNIEFLGRIDHQVKIRGYRVEIGEIESRLSCCPGIKEMAVLALQEDNGDKYICAYIVADKELSISGLRDNLSKELPDFMIPAYFVRVEKIPLTPNGKVDRKALPIPKTATGESYIAPRDEVEKKLTEIWSEVLVIDKEKIGIDTNFFELGGHSLKATILVSKIHKEFEVKVPLSEVFKSPRI